jgi:heme-degrading monooxygenase HmoA
MVAAMAEFTGPVTGLADISRMAGEAIEGWLREYDGYRGLVMLSNEDDRTSRVITFWDSVEAEARSRSGRKTMREQIAGSAGLEVVDFRVWEVPVYELPPTGGVAA